ncbi:MAG: hypothetical protein H6569_01580 [Lewinellaceae bacterium]|nr:hypothetical protein [Lewinellaceae bacterium]
MLCSNAAIQLQGSGSTGAQFSQLWTARCGSPASKHPHLGTNTIPTPRDQITNTINGCTASDATTVSSLYQAPAATVGGGTLTCAVNSIVLAASIDTLNTMYNWQGPNNFQSNLLHPAVSSGGNYLKLIDDYSIPLLWSIAMQRWIPYILQQQPAPAALFPALRPVYFYSVGRT